MRCPGLILALFVAACGSGGSTVTSSSVPPSDGGAPAGSTAPGGTAPTGNGGNGGGGAPGDMGSGGAGGSGGGGHCTASGSVAIASAPVTDGTMAIAVDDAFVYFTAADGTASGTFQLWRAPLDGSSPAVALGSTHDATATYLAVNALAAYVLNGDGQLMMWPKSGAAPSTLEAAHALPPHGGLYEILLADAYGYLYYGTAKDGQVQIVRRPEDGSGAASTLATLANLDAAAFDPSQVWLVTSNAVSHMAPDGSQLTQAMVSPYAAPTQLSGIAVDGSHVFTGTSDGRILAAAKQDGATLVPIAQVLPWPSQLSIDGGHLYILSEVADSAGERSHIDRVPVDGGDAITVIDRGGLIGGMAIHGAWIYYTLENEGVVYRTCK